jgi:hypothetical protein
METACHSSSQTWTLPAAKYTVRLKPLQARIIFQGHSSWVKIRSGEEEEEEEEQETTDNTYQS